MKTYNLSTNVIFGAGALSALSQYKNLNVTVVTDPMLREIGATDMVESLLSDCNVYIYWDIKPDPTIGQVRDTYKFVASKNTDVLIAFGGGSAIDTAKAVMLIDRRMNGDSKMKLVAIPTTSGTGSEVTNYTVVKDEENNRKFPLMDDCMTPSLAILDYTLTKSLPASVTAATGMDVITHALEAYVAKNANPITDSFAEKALALAFSNLYLAYKDGSCDEARENMMMASYLAGLAFNGAGLGLCHSIAHNIGGAFHVPHGVANSIALPHVIAYNADLDVPFGTDKSEIAKKYAKVAGIIGLPVAGVRLSVQNLVNEVKQLALKMGLPLSLLQFGVTRTEYNEVKLEIARNASEDGCLPLNPKDVPDEAMQKILDKIFA